MKADCKFAPLLVIPQEDIGFNLSYKHLNVFGSNDKKNRKLEVDAFNGRKESAIHTPSPSLEGIPHIMVDRAGVRATLTEVSVTFC